MKIDEENLSAYFSVKEVTLCHSRYMADNLSDRIDIHDKTKL